MSRTNWVRTLGLVTTPEGCTVTRAGDRLTRLIVSVFEDVILVPPSVPESPLDLLFLKSKRGL